MTRSESSSPDQDPFRYGWRYIRRVEPGGQEELDRLPLTLEDILHPQENDVIPVSTIEERDRRYLHDVLERRYVNDPHILTFSDCLIDWGVTGVKPHSPDITVLEGVRTKEGKWGTYRFAQDGGRPLLVVEIVSPDTRSNDVVIKPEHYHRVGVPLYVLVDQKKLDGPRWLVAYEYKADGYVQLTPDADGRVLLAPLEFRIGLRDGRVVCWDAASGQELGDYVRVCSQLEEAIAAQQEAERAVKAADDARAEAERRAKAAEDRFRELEEKLRRQGGNGQAP